MLFIDIPPLYYPDEVAMDVFHVSARPHFLCPRAQVDPMLISDPELSHPQPRQTLTTLLFVAIVQGHHDKQRSELPVPEITRSKVAFRTIATPGC
jgi:hypothetical protein